MGASPSCFASMEAVNLCKGGKNKMKFRIRTAAPKSRNTWAPDTNAKVQMCLFSTVALIAAASADAEQKLYNVIADAKAGRVMFPAV